MENKEKIIIILIVIIGIIGICVAGDYFIHNNNTEIIKPVNNTNISNTNTDLINKTSTDNKTTVKNTTDNPIVSEKIVSGGQSNITYREVTYADGNARQYDIETGKLIGSTFPEDQGRNGGPLPDMY